MSDYNTYAIRKLLSHSFNDEEFIVFCFDHFPDVNRNFSSAMGLMIKIQHLLDYCQRKGEMDFLLELMAKENPYQFKKYGAYIKRDSSTKLAIHLSGNLSELTIEQQEALSSSFQNLLSSLLEICNDEIEILNIKPGSIILEIQLQKDAATKLINWVNQDETWRKQLGIVGIELVQAPDTETNPVFSSDQIDPTNDQMKNVIAIKPFEQIDLVQVIGPVDTSSASHLQEAIMNLFLSGHHHIALDFTKVSYINSAGLRTLLFILRQSKNFNGTVQLVASSPKVNELLALSGLNSLLQPKVDDFIVEKLLAYIDAQQ